MKPATPLPWIYTHQSETDNSHDVVSREKILAMTGFSRAADSPPAKDAAYIVHACNAYPKLVEALKDYVGLAEGGLAEPLLRELGEL